MWQNDKMYILIECSYCNKVYNPKYINDEILCVKISDILEKDVNDSFYYNESSSIYDKLKDITKKYNLSI